MIAPDAVDAEIGAGETLALKSVALQKGRRCDVAWNARRFQAMETQRRKSEADHDRDRTGHMALAGVAGAHPIAERRRLRDAASYAPDRNAAHQRVRALLENEERKRLVA